MSATSVALVAATLCAGASVGSAGEARAQECNDAFCTPGIRGGVTLGAHCDNTEYYVFGTTSWGRLVFCGSPRRYEPRYFRSLPMRGVKLENSLCQGYENSVAQGFDGRYLFCQALDGKPLWRAKVD
ncbi:hypothetical protein H7K09_11210 [Mycolicibacterium duvalii]|nr:hypothetical protein [Mycolicibacterium duvalii]MCV7368024.1 hypothetical protein [Mycolicibacterium duvalii]